MHIFRVTPDLFRGPLCSQAKAERFDPRPFRQAAQWMPEQVRHDGEGQA
jgi:hypothetical protein